MVMIKVTVKGNHRVYGDGTVNGNGDGKGSGNILVV